MSLPTDRPAAPAPSAAPLTRGGLLARNTLWSFLGMLAPAVVALYAIPRLVAGLGDERFGLLSLAWVLVGYFNLFDLGLGRAITQLTADRLGREAHDEVGPLVWTALALMLAFGVAGGLLLALAAPWAIRAATWIPAHLAREALESAWLLAFAVPVVVTTAGLAGVLAAHQRLRAVNLLRIPLTLVSFLGPLAVLPFTQRLSVVVAVLVLGRTIGWLIHVALCLRAVPAMRSGARLAPALAGRMLRSGGWMTISNAVQPVMVSIDRFVIGAWVSLEAVAWYTTTYEIATKLWSLPGPLMIVMFPAFATSLAADPARTRALFDRTLRYLLVALAPAAFVLLVFARDGLELWLGATYAREGTRALQLLTLGAVASSLAYVPFSLVQSAGRARATAIAHLVELPLYVALLAWLAHAHGIVGAASAWLLRASIDAVVMFALAAGVFADRGAAARRFAPGVLASGVAFAGGLALAGAPTAAKLAITAALAALYVAWLWTRGLAEERRAFLARRRGAASAA